MASLIKYYTNRLEDLNKKYDEYTINYKENFVKYKIPVFNCDLSRGALNTPSCISQYSNDASVNAYVIAKEKIDNFQDLFNRGYFYKKVKIDDDFPKYLRENKNNFKDWII